MILSSEVGFEPIDSRIVLEFVGLKRAIFVRSGLTYLELGLLHRSMFMWL